MRSPFQAQRRHTRARFERDTILHGLEVEEPCNPAVEHRDYICSANGKYRLRRLPEDNGNLQERYERARATHDMTGSQCPADAYSRKYVFRAGEIPMPVVGDYRVAPPVLSWEQIKEARRVLSLWAKWDEEGWPERFTKKEWKDPGPPRLVLMKGGLDG